MKSPTLFLIVMMTVAANAWGATAAPKISGDYVEARTASVFAGACHYNGELVTTGQDAIMAWNITAGSWKNTDLSGVRVMAAVSSTANLQDQQAARKCDIVIDQSATPAQAKAVADWLQSRCGTSLGQVIAVRRGNVTFTHQGKAYAVRADGFAKLSVQAMPNDECCTQPNLVWYSPLMQLDHRKVGYTDTAAYLAGTAGDPWQRSDENSAFYGSFTF